MSPAPDCGPPPELLEWAGQSLGQAVQLIPLAGDGGGRRYWRVAGRGLLAMHGPDPAENRAWLDIGRHLISRGLPVPQIHDHLPEQGFFILQDLGDRHLCRALAEDEKSARGEYREAVAVLARFHRRGRENFDLAWCHQEKRYDAAMVEEKEINYFLEKFVIGHLKRPAPPADTLNEAKTFSRAVALEAPAEALIHRDYQSRNILATDGGPFVIDWQGARLGPGAYDLASLLNDPYVTLPQGFREELIGLYLEECGRRDEEKFSRELIFTGAARLMQNLGAYGNLYSQGKTSFAAWIPPAAERLRNHFRSPHLSPFPSLAALAEDICEQAKNYMKQTKTHTSTNQAL